ncbi:alpha/beta fold hydrolase [Streptomyces decoyicus]|uniref:alpha/beta fold hydrolase n=1 Tax=Streptomyces decoyicus TaxID=249567 RepID=UPI00386D7328
MTKTTIYTGAVPVAGGQIRLHQRGQRGPALVLVHYWGGSAATWEAVVDRLPADRATVRFDQRGWGASRSLSGPYHLDRLADDLLDVVRGAGLERYVLVGHSMGGKVAQLAASRRPQGLAGLVLLAPAPPQPPAHVTAEYREFLSHAYDSPQAVEQSLDQVLTAVPLDGSARAAAVRDSLAAEDPARREWPLHGIAADITAAARRVDVPVLALAGEHDRVEPAGMLRDHLLPHLPHAVLDVLPGCGHLLPLEAPAEVAARLEGFLADLDT